MPLTGHLEAWNFHRFRLTDNERDADKIGEDSKDGSTKLEAGRSLGIQATVGVCKSSWKGHRTGFEWVASRR